MDMMQAAMFLSGTILTMLGFVIIIAGVVIINNIISKYWKPVKILKFEEYPPRFMEEPTLIESKEKEKEKE